MTDIKTAMRIAFSPDALSHAVDEIERLNAENERLRGLITTWADACDLMMKVGSLDTTTPEGVAAIQALTALRKAVGR